MRITVLTYLERESDRSHDPVADQVAEALSQGGHQASVFGVHGDVRKLSAGLSRRRPELIFNLMEMFGGDVAGDVQAVAILDSLGIPYTGGGPAELLLRQDKGLAKKILAFDGIAYPNFVVFGREDGDLESGGKLHMPIFVKPLRSDASIGIDSGSLVRSTQELMERVRLVHDKYQDSALAEEYIEGREFYVGVLGNQDPVAFPPIEMDFSGLPAGTPRVLGARAKWHKGSAEYRGTRAVLAELPDELRARLHKVSLAAYRALRVRDYGRVDLRLTDSGDLYVIEVNASCYLERSGEFATAAAAAGIDYPALVNRIAALALQRDRHRHRSRRAA